MTKDLDFNKSEQYILSIRLSTDGFSFSIYSPIIGSDFYSRTYPVNTQRSMAANVKSFLSATDELKYKFKQTNILIHSKRYTIVPLDFFEDESMEQVFYHNVREKRNEIVLCNVLSNSNSVVIFSLDKLTHVFLSEHFPNARFFSSISPQIEFLTIRSRLGNCKKLYLNINNENIDVIAMDNGRLMLANTYQSVSPNDINYFILNIWQKTGFDQNRDELHITGIKELKNIIIPELKKYISHVYSINPQAEFNNSEISKIENIPFDVQSLILCE
ncbi:DUF3822 family protein [uncultured Bacteroides sp.]|uniref:DUF3822 family protein n=1 Tax=uncultured Bacteroides sp. TaxID=162156 RepID=UPI00262C1AEA|nr:DUF3822 family protein [uncultured Bacteroides sp.]